MIRGEGCTILGDVESTTRFDDPEEGERVRKVERVRSRMAETEISKEIEGKFGRRI